MSALRLVFMGTPDFSVPALEALVAAGHEVVSVYTQPPRPAGRGKKLVQTSVHRAAEAMGIPVRTPTSLRDNSETEAFAALKVDVAVVVAYGLILPGTILTASRLGCLNIHASLLPRWRGAAPIQRALLAGDSEAGISIMRMDEGLDTGPVMFTRRLAIGPRENAADLHDRLAQLGASSIVDALDSFGHGTPAFVAQSEEGTCYAAKLDKTEGEIDWTRSAEEIDRRVRALTPWPGCFFHLPEPFGGERVKLLGAEPASEPHDGGAPPGAILDRRTAVLACGAGALRLTHLQRPGRQPVTGPEFLAGLKLEKGDRITV